VFYHKQPFLTIPNMDDMINFGYTKRMNTKILELDAVSKAFPGVKALDGVSFDVAGGEVHALVGENGAGKSTLIKILGGVFHQDCGTILFNGADIRFKNTHHSQQAGISVIYQEFNLLPDLSVAENIFIGREPRRLLFLDWGKIARDTEQILGQLDVSLDPKTLVEELCVAEKQMVEIAKALSFATKLIIMDEPTAALSENEVQKLFAVIRTLKAQGTTILFVSHRLKEVFAIADRITVLRDGRFIATKSVAETDEKEIIRLMVGRDIGALFPKDSTYSKSTMLSVQNVNIRTSASSVEPNILKDVSFELHKGEILGVAGLMGSGKRQLAEMLYGLLPLDSGDIFLNGQRLNITSPQQAIALGIGFVSEDRKSDSIFPELSVLHNMSMAILRRLTRWRGIVLNLFQERKSLQDYTARLDIRYQNPHQKIGFLSGGNQQKVLLARALAANCRLLILCEPTRGVDVGAKAEIHSLINELAKKGVAIIMISSELPEIIGISDSCIVMYRGKITGHLSKAEMTEANIIGCATGQVTIGLER